MIPPHDCDVKTKGFRELNHDIAFWKYPHLTKTLTMSTTQSAKELNNIAINRTQRSSSSSLLIITSAINVFCVHFFNVQTTMNCLLKRLNITKWSTCFLVAVIVIVAVIINVIMNIHINWHLFCLFLFLFLSLFLCFVEEVVASFVPLCAMLHDGLYCLCLMSRSPALVLISVVSLLESLLLACWSCCVLCLWFNLNLDTLMALQGLPYIVPGQWNFFVYQHHTCWSSGQCKIQKKGNSTEISSGTAWIFFIRIVSISRTGHCKEDNARNILYTLFLRHYQLELHVNPLCVLLCIDILWPPGFHCANFSSMNIIWTPVIVFSVW